MLVHCGQCGAEIDQPPDVPTEQRIPCPECGSTTRIVELAATLHSRGSLEAGLTVIRGVNEIRLALLGILVGIALTVGFGTPGPWYGGVLAGLASFVLSAALLRWEPSRSALMGLMHRLTGH